ncbi:hypothetical protein GQX74_009071 [Glossina fuscipes]|nr:hypothetical protein GQX74_009071 [Glossina fuscipes]
MEKKSKKKSKSHATTHTVRNVFCADCSVATQVFLILTLFVIGNLSAWQENVRPKLYVELDTSNFKNCIRVRKLTTTNALCKISLLFDVQLRLRAFDDNTMSFSQSRSIIEFQINGKIYVAYAKLWEF